MKKSILLASAALAALSFTSCNNEVDMFEPIGSEKATINLNVSKDEVMLTRADGDPVIENADLSAWEAKVGSNSWVKANTLVNKTYDPDTYTIQVGNYQSEALAMAAKSGAGDAYYTLTQNVTLVKGVNNLTFACGKAKNAKVTVDWSGTSGVAGLTMTSVKADQAENTTAETPARSYTYTAGGDAYFYAGTDVVCTINYTYNGTPKSISKTISNPSAATKYAFTVSANSNGTITTLTITYDSAMYTGESTSTVIDAATGNKVE